MVVEEQHIVDDLRAIQDRHGYLPRKELYELATKLDVPVYRLHGVATFYPHFRLQPPPKSTIHVCTDLPCHLRAGGPILLKAKQIAAGNPAVEVKGCSCLGQCDRAPAALINDHPRADGSVRDLVEKIEVAIAGEPVEPQHFPGLSGPFKTDPYAAPSEHYDAVRKLAASGDYAAVVKAVEAANLRGMGGAGTRAIIKWDTVFKAHADQKYIVCNADESEVGTIKDREIMKNLPHLLVEAMVIAGITVGATRGYIYCRHEYHEQIEGLGEEIKRARELGVIGENAAGSGKAFELEVFVSPGGYIQGEETALLEAMEGRRGQPRNKMWDVGLARGVPAFMGLFGKPTLINNVETLAYLPLILSKGADYFKSLGINGSQGLKWVGVGGHVNKPGVFEVPMGTRYTDVIKMAGGVSGGRKLKAFAPSGPTGGFLPASVADVPMDFPIFDKGKPVNEIAKIGGTVGSAAIIIVADGTCMLDLALNFTRFYRNESCGKCVPCRVGSQKMVDIIYGMTQGTATPGDIDTVARLGETLVMTSICGLGQVVPMPIQSVLKYWKDEVDEHMVKKRCVSGVCFSSGK